LGFVFGFFHGFLGLGSGEWDDKNSDLKKVKKRKGRTRKQSLQLVLEANQVCRTRFLYDRNRVHLTQVLCLRGQISTLAAVWCWNRVHCTRFSIPKLSLLHSRC